MADSGHGPLRRSGRADLSARGEPRVWCLGGALALGIVMVVGFLALVVWNGVAAFWPRPVERLVLDDGTIVAGEPVRTETYSTEAGAPGQPPRTAERTLYRIANFDLYNEDFRWVADPQIAAVSRPEDLLFVERTEWGPFIGTVVSADLAGEVVPGTQLDRARLRAEVDRARARREEIREIERHGIGRVNRSLEEQRLDLRRVELEHGAQSAEHDAASRRLDAEAEGLQRRYRELAAEAARIKAEDEAFRVTLAEVGGREKSIRLSEIVRLYAPNELGVWGKLGVYGSRWLEFLTEEPREANTEGGVLPAIFGTFAMTVLMALFVAPFGVMAALYLREYAEQGRFVSAVRISVNNLAGVPSIVYGVFGLGFFAYGVGASLDRWLYPERLPSPTFGTGGILWASLTLALLTVPVVIVATEEALAAVPQSMREGSLACGASKWQTIRYVVLPRALPGIMTGLILAMARGAGEVAPLMLVGVVKLAPELPVDGVFPFVHLERSFMHLGFHIYDVGFQSRNSEAGKPMVFVTTLLLIGIVAALNAVAIAMRNRLKSRFATGHF